MTPLHQRIIELVPDIGNQPCTHRLMHDENGCPFGEHYRPITLADVLRAINSQFICVNSWGGDFMFDRLNTAEPAYREWFYTNENGERCVWNLTTNLDGQSDECKTFLSKILGV